MEIDCGAKIMWEEPAFLLMLLSALVAAFFWVEKKYDPKLFHFFPPLLFIYAIPIFWTNVGLIPAKNPAYDMMKAYGLPAFLVLMLMDIDIRSAVKIMGKGVLVMLFASVGVVVGGVVAFVLVHPYMGEDAPAVFGTLAGSWIGGTGNMAAAGEALGVSPAGFGLAVLADSAIYIIWLPILLGSKSFAKQFAKWTKVDPDRVKKMEEATAALKTKTHTVTMLDLLLLMTIVMGVIWFAGAVSGRLPDLGGMISKGTWRILIITTLGIGLSYTRARDIPGTYPIAMALIYVFVATMGARASLEDLSSAPAFLAGALLWIMIHGVFCLLAAKFFKVDVATAAIASAANVGGAASAPVVAAYHNQALVPASILMALIGYAIGNYLAILLGTICRFLA
jgi:uncharacterized membrane protein